MLSAICDAAVLYAIRYLPRHMKKKGNVMLTQPLNFKLADVLVRTRRTGEYIEIKNKIHRRLGKRILTFVSESIGRVIVH